MKIHRFASTLAAAALLGFSSCATMQQAWTDQNCHREAAYEKGMNDARNSGSMNSAYAANCPPEMREAVYAGYHEGFSAGMTPQQQQVILQPSGPPALINVNIGGGPPPMQQGPDPRAWFCRMKAFTDQFEGFGPTQLEATENVASQCRSKYDPMFCRNSDCRRNE